MRLKAFVLVIAVAFAASAQNASAPAAPEQDAPGEARALVEQAARLGPRQAAKARALLEKAAELAPEELSVLLPLARAQAATRQTTAAYRTLVRILNREPNHPEAAAAFGEVLEARKDPKNAAKAYLVAAREGKDKVAAVKAGRLAPEEDAVTVFEGFRYAALYGSLERSDLPKYGAAALALQKNVDAREIYGKLVAAQPADEAAALHLAEAHVRLEEYDAAATQLDAVLARNPANADALLARADLAAAQGQQEVEEAALRALAALKADHPQVHKRLARLLARKGDAAGVKASWEAQLRVDGQDVDALEALARIALDEKVPGLAVRHAKALTSLRPKHAAASLLVGLALEMSGDCKGAVKPLEAGIPSTDAAEPRARLGACLFSLQQNPKARAALADALERDPRQQLALEALGELALSEKKLAEAAQRLGEAAVLPARDNDADFQARVADLWIRAGDAAKAQQLLDRALALAPEHPLANLLRGRLLLLAGDAAAALPLVELAAAALPKNVEAHTALAQALFATGAARKAEDAAKAALVLSPGDPAASEVLGNVLFPAPSARAHLEAAANGTPGRLAQQNLAELQIEAKDFKAARRTLAALRSDNGARTARLRASVEYRSGELEAAENAIGPALLAHGEDGALAALGGDIAFERGDRKAARSRLEKAAALGSLAPRGRARFCDVLARDGDHQRAITEGRGAIEAGYDEADVRANLGYALYHAGQLAEGKAELDLAVKKGAKDKTTNLILGQIAMAEKREDEALTWFDKVLAIDAADPVANGVSGQVLVRRAKYEEAVPRLEKAHAATGEIAVGTALARAYLSLGRHGKAQKLVESFPEGALPPAEALTLKGRVAHALGNYKRADEQYAKALEHAPEDADALFHRGQNYLKLPHYDNAIAHLERAQRADPVRPEISLELARLYAENDQRDKAAAALARAEEIEAKNVEERRKAIPEDQIRAVVIHSFRNDGGRSDHEWLGEALANAMASDLSKSAHLRVLERSALENLRDEAERQLADETLSEADLARLGKLASADSVLVGSYMVAGDILQINARMVDIFTGQVGRSGSATGTLSEFSRVQKAVALELLGQYVTLTEGERAAVSRDHGQNIESLRLMTEARRLERDGDLRGAQALFREAVQMDQGSVHALAGLVRNLKELEVKNRIAVFDFEKGSADAEDWIGTAIVNTLSSKLPQVQGIQVVERRQVEAIELEKDFMADEDNVDQSSLPEIRQKLAAGCVLVGTYHAGNGQVLINARLIDMEDQKVLLGDRVSGPESKVFDLSNELAERIARRLIGAPSEEEMAALREKREFDQYKREMQELARLRAEESRRKAEDERLASLPPEHPERASRKQKPEQIARQTKPRPSDADAKVWVNARAGMGRLSDLFRGGAVGIGGLAFSLYGREGDVVRRGWTIAMDSSNFFDPGRGSQQAAFALYDLGYDLDFRLSPFSWAALRLGANASVGYAQSREAGFAQQVASGFAAGVTPRVGLEMRTGPVAWSADLGRRFVWGLSGDADISPLGFWYLQGGVSYASEWNRRSSSDTRSQLGYRAHTVLSSGIDAYRRYGGLAGGTSGGLRYVHGFTYGSDTQSGSNALYVGYSSTSPRGDELGDPLQYLELAWDYSWRTFSSEVPFNPVIGWRLGMAGYRDGDGGLFGSTAGAFTAAARVGVDVTTKYLLLTPTVGYDAIIGSGFGERNDLGGVTVGLGAALRL